jgi:hypothetical protein
MLGGGYVEGAEQFGRRNFLLRRKVSLGINLFSRTRSCLAEFRYGRCGDKTFKASAFDMPTAAWGGKIESFVHYQNATLCLRMLTFLLQSFLLTFQISHARLSSIQ